jgi:5-methylthioadenosine/S-adenosylhomocysteine deaminase
MRTLIANGHVVTVNAAHDIIPHGYVAINGERIEAVGSAGQEPGGVFDRRVDASGMIVVPGLINMHQHPWMNLLKGLADGLLLENWVFNFSTPGAGTLTAEDIKVSSYLAALEMVRTGTTCLLNHSGRFRVPEHQALFIEPMAEVGIRHVFANLFLCRTPRALDHPHSAEEAQAYNRTLIETWHGAHGGLTRMALVVECNAHHTELGKSSDELVVAGHAIARETDLPVASHMSGGTLSMNMGFTKYLRLTGRRDVEYLASLGVLDHHWLLKHGIHFSDTDIDTVHRTGAHIVYTPTSESMRGGGVGPVASFRRAGINCALGTDGPAVDYTVDMVEQMKACLVLQNARYRDPEAMSASDVLDMATIDAAKALGLDREIGSLEPGKRADIAIFDLREPHLRPLHDPLTNFILCARGADADTVFVNGRMLLREGRFVEFRDVDEVIDEATARGRELAVRSGLAARASLNWTRARNAAMHGAVAK